MLLFTCIFFFVLGFFLVYFFLGSVLYVFFFSQEASWKCHIVLYECLCFNLFVVCQNEDLKHVAGTVKRKREDLKKITLQRMTAYVSVQLRGKVCFPRRDFREQQRTDRLQSLKIKKAVFRERFNVEFPRSSEYFLIPSMMSLLSLPPPRLVLLHTVIGLVSNAINTTIWAEVPLGHRSGIWPPPWT